MKKFALLLLLAMAIAYALYTRHALKLSGMFLSAPPTPAAALPVSPPAVINQPATASEAIVLPPVTRRPPATTTVTLVLRNGGEISGVIAKETDDAITLHGTWGEVVFPRGEIVRIERDTQTTGQP